MVTRGNVAIYCYNALTATTWDITESTDGKLTSSTQGTKTILAKYFSDFTDSLGNMKSFEEVEVELSGAVSTEIGANQIKLHLTDLADDIEAEKAPKKGYEEATYYVVNAGVKDEDRVIAYVPAGVANIASLTGKKVDVIFGKDNEVAYLAVTDDSYEDQFLTAFNNVDREIEIDGEVYDLADSVTVKVFGYKVGVDTKDANVINPLLTGTGAAGLNITTPKKDITRSVVVDYILDAEDEVDTINFKFSVNGFAKVTTETSTPTVKVNEFIVEKISAKNALTVAGNSALSDLDDYEDAEPRVIKNGEVAEVADIEVGDVVTEVLLNTTVKLMIVTSNTVEGTVEDLNKNAFSINGTDYKVVAQPHYNEDGEIDDYAEKSTAATVYGLFEDEEVTAYLNFAGEVVAVVGESEATGMVLGVVTKDASDEEDSDDVEYVELRILAEDGSEKKYKVYNEKSGKDLANDDASRELVAGDVVMFSADADRVIKADEIRKLAANEEGLNFKSNSDIDLTIAPISSVDRDTKKINTNYRYSSSTIVINPAEEELITNWDALVAKGSDTAFATTGIKVADTAQTPSDTEVSGYIKHTDNKWYPAKTVNTNVYLFTKGTKVVYIVAWIDEANYGASDTQYGILLDTRKEKDADDETIYIATILVDGAEVEYECDSDFRRDYEEGTFISFDVSDGAIVDPAVVVMTEVSDVIADAENDDNYIGYTYANSAWGTTLESAIVDHLKALGLANATVTNGKTYRDIKVESVETVEGDSYIVFEEVVVTPATYSCTAGCSEGACTTPTHAGYAVKDAAVTRQDIKDLADNYIVYDLVDSEEVDTINEGDYVLVFDANEDPADGYEIVIVL